jgi:hypothetical protein
MDIILILFLLIIAPRVLFVLLGAVFNGQFGEASRLRAAEKKLRRRIARESLAAERASRAQQQQWEKQVRAEMSRGTGGRASQEEATEGLSGPGGRRSELEDRWF